MIGSLWALTILSLTNGISLLTSYIANNTFPYPLSEVEEAEFITRLHNGDEKARHILAEHNLRLVAHIVKILCTQTKISKRSIVLFVHFSTLVHFGTLSDSFLIIYTYQVFCFF